MDNAVLHALTYEPIVAQDAVPYLPAMRVWRRVTGWSICLFIAGLLLYVPVALAALVPFLVASALCLYCMVRDGLAEVGAGFAVRHLILAVVLLPIAGLGVFLVSRLVEADLVNWRLANRPPA